MLSIPATTLFRTFLLVAAALPLARAEDVTLFRPQAPEPTVFPYTTPLIEWVGISPAGVDEEGYTHYVASQVYSVDVIGEEHTTKTVKNAFGRPQSYTITFKADATRDAITISTDNQFQTGATVGECLHHPENGTVVCSQTTFGRPPGAKEDEITTYHETTYTATREPYFTISNVETYAIPTITAGQLEEEDDARNDKSGAKAVAVGSVGGAWGVSVLASLAVSLLVWFREL
ncbi:hypothetical protein CC1G_07786 [Coprinopsis cinerea okayama7|uniref:Uncharacterized protein n=1 Tax=Coprinopsis cinerea (strain Okayama-7 / 130 / ATCC MYA-4618 / FGSC 9003) TaxID=240176 RepID=A8NP15_COPC7|nr:hypothetical protein CC1G_07786 [Coprinopsis cinerea okayama7\|eukprot:XP_001835243.1 hypothetical protein CC1G_07786 [Coprinopsis cinerea okayama7\